MTSSEPLLTTRYNFDELIERFVNHGTQFVPADIAAALIHDARMAHVLKAAHEAAVAALENQRKSDGRYAVELDAAAEILQRIHPIGKVKGIGRLEVEAALKGVEDALSAATKEHDYIRRVLSLIDPYDCDDVLWSVEDGTVGFQVNCSDVFWWGAADCEEITPENLSELERAYAEVKAVLPGDGAFWEPYAQMLFACRARKLRPQGPQYKAIPEAMWPLFDAAGPERTDRDGAGRPDRPVMKDCSLSQVATLEQKLQQEQQQVEVYRRRLAELETQLQEWKFVFAAETCAEAVEKDTQARRVVETVKAYCRKHLHSGVSPGKQEACGEVLGILEGKP